MNRSPKAPIAAPRTSIPLIDLRGKALTALVSERPEAARAMITNVSESYGFLSRTAASVLLPILDRRSHEWLQRTKNPYLHEIEHLASALGMPGAYTFNVCYEWACTTGAFESGQSVSLLRILDWGFPKLGSSVIVLHQKSAQGEFYNITWPGYAGMVNGMAPQRFAAAINIAPERHHGRTRVGNWIKNKGIVGRQEGLPPAHLLRRVFEQAADYESAKRMLATTQIMAPVIYTLTGMKAGEGCIIERTENDAGIFELGAQPRITTANHFRSRLVHFGRGWKSRGVDSQGRFAQSCTIDPNQLATDNFDWLTAPIINWETRLALVANAATNRLMVQGFAGKTRVTDVFQLPSVSKTE